MAVRLEFSLSDSDFDKLRRLKKADGRSDLTFNDYAKELLGGALYRKCREYDWQKFIEDDED